MEWIRFFQLARMYELSGDLLFHCIDIIEQPYPTATHLRRHFMVTTLFLLRMSFFLVLISLRYAYLRDFLFGTTNGLAVLVWWIVFPFVVTIIQYAGRALLRNRWTHYGIIVVVILHVDSAIVALNVAKVLIKHYLDDPDKNQIIANEIIKSALLQNVNVGLGFFLTILLLLLNERFYYMICKTFRVWMTITALIQVILLTLFLFELKGLITTCRHPLGMICLGLIHILGFEGGQY